MFIDFFGFQRKLSVSNVYFGNFIVSNLHNQLVIRVKNRFALIFLLLSGSKFNFVGKKLFKTFISTLKCFVKGLRKGLNKVSIIGDVSKFGLKDQKNRKNVSYFLFNQRIKLEIVFWFKFLKQVFNDLFFKNYFSSKNSQNFCRLENEVNSKIPANVFSNLMFRSNLGIISKKRLLDIPLYYFKIARNSKRLKRSILRSILQSNDSKFLKKKNWRLPFNVSGYIPFRYQKKVTNYIYWFTKKFFNPFLKRLRKVPKAQQRSFFFLRKKSFFFIRNKDYYFRSLNDKVLNKDFFSKRLSIYHKSNFCKLKFTRRSLLLYLKTKKFKIFKDSKKFVVRGKEQVVERAFRKSSTLRRFRGKLGIKNKFILRRYHFKKFRSYIKRVILNRNFSSLVSSSSNFSLKRKFGFSILKKLKLVKFNARVKKINYFKFYIPFLRKRNINLFTFRRFFGDNFGSVGGKYTEKQILSLLKFGFSFVFYNESVSDLKYEKGEVNELIFYCTKFLNAAFPIKFFRFFFKKRKKGLGNFSRVAFLFQFFRNFNLGNSSFLFKWFCKSSFFSRLFSIKESLFPLIANHFRFNFFNKMFFIKKSKNFPLHSFLYFGKLGRYEPFIKDFKGFVKQSLSYKKKRVFGVGISLRKNLHKRICSSLKISKKEKKNVIRSFFSLRKIKQRVRQDLLFAGLGKKRKKILSFFKIFRKIVRSVPNLSERNFDFYPNVCYGVLLTRPRSFKIVLENRGKLPSFFFSLFGESKMFFLSFLKFLTMLKQTSSLVHVFSHFIVDGFFNLIFFKNNLKFLNIGDFLLYVKSLYNIRDSLNFKKYNDQKLKLLYSCVNFNSVPGKVIFTLSSKKIFLTVLNSFGSTLLQTSSGSLNLKQKILKRFSGKKHIRKGFKHAKVLRRLRLSRLLVTNKLDKKKASKVSFSVKSKKKKKKRSFKTRSGLNVRFLNFDSIRPLFIFLENFLLQVNNPKTQRNLLRKEKLRLKLRIKLSKLKKATGFKNRQFYLRLKKKYESLLLQKQYKVKSFSKKKFKHFRRWNGKFSTKKVKRTFFGRFVSKIKSRKVLVSLTKKASFVFNSFAIFSKKKKLFDKNLNSFFNRVAGYINKGNKFDRNVRLKNKTFYKRGNFLKKKYKLFLFRKLFFFKMMQAKIKFKSLNLKLLQKRFLSFIFIFKNFDANAIQFVIFSLVKQLLKKILGLRYRFHRNILSFLLQSVMKKNIFSTIILNPCLGAK